MASSDMISQSNEPRTINVTLDVLQQNYTSTTHAVVVNTQMTFKNFKQMIFDMFNTTDFELYFA